MLHRITEKNLIAEGYKKVVSQFGMPFYILNMCNMTVVVNPSTISHNGKSYHKPKVRIIDGDHDNKAVEITGLKWIESIGDAFNVFNQSGFQINEDNLIANGYVKLNGFGDSVFGKLIRKGFGHYITCYDNHNELYMSFNKHYVVKSDDITNLKEIERIIDVIERDYSNYKI